MTFSKEKKRVAYILMIFVFLYTITPVYSQDDVDCSGETLEAIVDALGEQLETIEDQMDLISYGIAVNLVIQACNGELNDGEDNVSDTETVVGLSRLNPVPLGDFFSFATGMLRVVDVETKSSDEYSSSFTVPEGEQVYYFQFEYVCELEDVNETCNGTDVTSSSSYILNSGNILDEAPIYVDLMNVVGNEAYSGATLTGGLWFSLPEDEALNLFRVDLELNEGERRETVFFSLSED